MLVSVNPAKTLCKQGFFKDRTGSVPSAGPPAPIQGIMAGAGQCEALASIQATVRVGNGRGESVDPKDTCKIKTTGLRYKGEGGKAEVDL